MIKYAVFGRSAVLAILLSGAAAASAQAQDVTDAQIAAARQAISSMKVTDNYDNILPNLAERLKAQFIQASPNFQTQISTIVDQQALRLRRVVPISKRKPRRSTRRTSRRTS